MDTAFKVFMGSMILIFVGVFALAWYSGTEGFQYYEKEQIVCRNFTPHGWNKSTETTCYKITPIVK